MGCKWSWTGFFLMHPRTSKHQTTSAGHGNPKPVRRFEVVIAGVNGKTWRG